jgi:hypothetical protein
MTPVALSKAESLAKFAQASGSPLNTFALTLTRGEAYELLDYMAEGGLGKCQFHDDLVRDIRQAKSDGDPWVILRNFQLQGLDIVCVDSLH